LQEGLLDIDILFSDGTFTPLRKALNQSLIKVLRWNSQRIKIHRQVSIDFLKISPKPMDFFPEIFDFFLQFTNS
jgi:hypothetical protein